MKRTLSLLFIAAMASCSLLAQDDMYFTPKSKAEIAKEKAEKEKKKAEKKAAIEAEMERLRIEAEKEEARKYAEYIAELGKQAQEILEIKRDWLRKNRHRLSQTEDGELVYHVGRDISADEYNRRGKFKSKVTPVSPDSVASDIIDFTAGNGEYPDSIIASIDSIAIDPDFKRNKRHIDFLDDDVEYYYSRRMNRFDYFFGSRRAWMLYNNPWHSHWAYDPFLWNDPWYWYDSWTYSPWFWSDPWYYDSYGYLGWSPFYYHSWGGWGHTSHHHYGGHHNHNNPIFVGGGHHGGGHHHNNGGGGHVHTGSSHHTISSNINNYDRAYGSRRTGVGSRNSGVGYSNSNRTQAADSHSNYNSSSNYSSSNYNSSNYSSSSSSSGRTSATNSGSVYSSSRSNSYSNSSSGSSYSSGSRSTGGGGGGNSGGGGFRGRR